MKKLLVLIFFLPIISFAATGVSVLENAQNKWDVYYTSPSGKQFFIYEDQYKLDNTSGPGEPLFYKTEGNIFWIMYGCYGNLRSCFVRYVDTATNQESKPISNPAISVDSNYNFLRPINNLSQGVVLTFNYPISGSYVLIPIFEECKHPFVYKLPHLSDGPDVGSQFLPNGDLYLNMLMNNDANQQVTILIDYKKLYQDCQSNS